MASDLISRKELLELYEGLENQELKVPVEVVVQNIKDMPTVDAVEVVHGVWNRISGDIHSSGYGVCCSVCHKRHFVHHKFSLGALNCDELFKEPNYCPNCGARMDGDLNE